MEQYGNAFMAEFEALKAKHGDAFADLTVARFKRSKKIGQITIQDEFVPYWCREDDEGFIQCEDERPV
jgi:hypothetical protein